MARSADQDPEFNNNDRVGAVPTAGPYPINVANRKNHRIPALKQWKNKQKQQLNETCKSLLELQSCLNGISRECLGNFHYHSHEVFSTQWLSRLHCHDPNLKPYRNLIKSVLVQETEKVPVPRPIPTPEETQAKLDAIFGSMNIGRSGVILPTLTRTATQKFNAMGQQEQQLDKGGLSQESYFKGRHLLSANEILDYKSQSSPLKNPSAGFITSQLLLIPCFLVILIALITTTMRRYFKPTSEKAYN